MIIGFRKQFKGTGTYLDGMYTNFEQLILKEYKLHTMREDVNCRYKEGMKIQLATGVRTKEYNCFKEDTIKHIQRISIEHTSKEPYIKDREFYVKYRYEEVGKEPISRYSRVGILLPKNDNSIVDVVDNYLNFEQVVKLATFDGFKGSRDFFHYFNQNKTYRLIHWTDLKY